MVRRKSLRLLLSESQEPTHPQPDIPQKRWLRLPYLGKPANELSRELRRYGYWVGFYPATTLSTLICLKDKIPADQKSGVYRLVCGECDSQYIGQTGRTFKKRFSEHRSAYTAHKPHQSAMAKHCLDQNHDFNKVTGKIIHPCSKGRLMNRVEETETISTYNSAGANLLNDLRATFTTPFTRFVLDFTPPVDASSASWTFMKLQKTFSLPISLVLLCSYLMMIIPSWSKPVAFFSLFI